MADHKHGSVYSQQQFDRLGGLAGVTWTQFWTVAPIVVVSLLDETVENGAIPTDLDAVFRFSFRTVPLMSNRFPSFSIRPSVIPAATRIARCPFLKGAAGLILTSPLRFVIKSKISRSNPSSSSSRIRSSALISRLRK